MRAAPRDAGSLELIAIRPAPRLREVVDAGVLDLQQGMIGDRWTAGDKGTADQVTVTGARYAALISGGDDPARWAATGDQLFVDLDLSHANLPAGARLAVGDAVLEVTPEPHLGCGKYIRRFGVEAMKLANTAEGRELRLRGMHARVVEPATVRRGDPVHRLG